MDLVSSFWLRSIWKILLLIKRLSQIYKGLNYYYYFIRTFESHVRSRMLIVNRIYYCIFMKSIILYIRSFLGAWKMHVQRISFYLSTGNVAWELTK